MGSQRAVDTTEQWTEQHYEPIKHNETQTPKGQGLCESIFYFHGFWQEFNKYMLIN